MKKIISFQVCLWVLGTVLFLFQKQVVVGATPPHHEPQWEPLATAPQNHDEVVDLLITPTQTLLALNFDRVAYLNTALENKKALETGLPFSWNPVDFIDKYNGTNCLGTSLFLQKNWGPKWGVPLSVAPAVSGQQSGAFSHTAALVKTNQGFVLVDVALHEPQPISLTQQEPEFAGDAGLFQWDQGRDVIVFNHYKVQFNYEYKLLHLNNSVSLVMPHVFKNNPIYIIQSVNADGLLKAYVYFNFCNRKIKYNHSTRHGFIEKSTGIDSLTSVDKVLQFLPQCVSIQLNLDTYTLASRLWEVIENWEWLEKTLGIPSEVCNP